MQKACTTSYIRPRSSRVAGASMRRQAAQATERDSRSEATIAPTQSVGFMDVAPKREKICRFAIARSTTTDPVRRARTPRRFAPASTSSIGSVARAAEGALGRGVAFSSPFQTRKLMVPVVLLLDSIAALDPQALAFRGVES